MPPDEKERRPGKSGVPQDALDGGTEIIVTAETVRPRRCGALIRGHLTGCGNPPEPGSDRCAEHGQPKVQADGPAA